MNSFVRLRTSSSASVSEVGRLRRGIRMVGLAAVASAGVAAIPRRCSSGERTHRTTCGEGDGESSEGGPPPCGIGHARTSSADETGSRSGIWAADGTRPGIVANRCVPYFLWLRRNECFEVGMARSDEQIAGQALLHDLPAVHHRHPVGHVVPRHRGHGK